jgi:hypothetical protein
MMHRLGIIEMSFYGSPSPRRRILPDIRAGTLDRPDLSLRRPIGDTAYRVAALSVV